MYWSLEHQLRVGGGGIANGRGTLDSGAQQAMGAQRTGPSPPAREVLEPQHGVTP